MSNLIRILETDDWVVDYDKGRGMYRVSKFEDYHFKDEIWFDAYEEREYLVRCKDCILKHYSESNNLWCDIFNTIMPEDGYCCFGDNNLESIEIDSEIIDKFNDIPHTSFLLTSEQKKKELLNE